MESHAASRRSASSPPRSLPPTAPDSSSAHSAPHAAYQESQPSHPDSTSPSTDGGRHPRGKRNRTRPRDKQILEAAYAQDAKPDKAARLELANQIPSMTEKNVQIWFQNRRQNDRRKSRPLPQDFVQRLIDGRVRVVPSDLNMELSKDASGLPIPQPGQPVMGLPDHSDSVSCHSDVEPGTLREALQERKGPITWEGIGSSFVEAAGPGPLGPVERPGEPRPVPSRSFSGSTGYVSNRRNPTAVCGPAPKPRCDDPFSSGPSPITCPPQPQHGVGPHLVSMFHPPSLPPSRCFLSTSLDGKAEVAQAIASPPRPTISPAAVDPPGLPEPSRRSCPSFPEFNPSLPPIRSLPPRLSRGRSRDVLAWESCCGSESLEDALTVQAKHESSGSALGAISLVRSTSSTSVANLEQSIGAKRSSPLAGNEAARRSGVTKRPKLSNASSSLGRLETTPAAPSTTKHNIRRTVSNIRPNKPETTTSLVSGNDSDKENWSPDEDGNPRRFRRVASTLTSSGRRPLPSGAPPSSSSKQLDTNDRHPRRTPLQGSRPGSFAARRALTSPAGGWNSQQYRQGKRARRRSQSPVKIFEDGGGGGGGEDENEENGDDDDDDVAQFMRAANVSPSKQKDVEVAEGLLSLRWAHGGM
ncbi:hypothetical protein C8A00DRAFT_12224 [Chaetomidium leptoderma]|uniref:Homeobox domain-containing protein n=1 Tax=Chaetomidium leptoderma TaxID=669021 RepID=A0AAN6VVC7_9PEZI|nr:hypothetical protein C8A00DRAFT_12224 [Chaetomidium leptoderma]